MSLIDKENVLAAQYMYLQRVDFLQSEISRIVNRGKQLGETYEIEAISALDEIEQELDGIDECLELIDESSSDIAVDEFGNIKENHRTVARAKAQVDTRFRFLEKMTPRVYGPKKSIEMSGSVDGEYKVSGLEIVFKDEEDED